jgi:hypothetical protein
MRLVPEALLHKVLGLHYLHPAVTQHPAQQQQQSGRIPALSTATDPFSAVSSISITASSPTQLSQEGVGAALQQLGVRFFAAEHLLMILEILGMPALVSAAPEAQVRMRSSLVSV